MLGSAVLPLHFAVLPFHEKFQFSPQVALTHDVHFWWTSNSRFRNGFGSFVVDFEHFWGKSREVRESSSIIFLFS